MSLKDKVTCNLERKLNSLHTGSYQAQNFVQKLRFSLTYATAVQILCLFFNAFFVTNSILFSTIILFDLSGTILFKQWPLQNIFFPVKTINCCLALKRTIYDFVRMRPRWVLLSHLVWVPTPLPLTIAWETSPTPAPVLLGCL